VAAIGVEPCWAGGGKRTIRIAVQSIVDVTAMTVGEAHDFFSTLLLTGSRGLMKDALSRKNRGWMIRNVAWEVIEKRLVVSVLKVGHRHGFLKREWLRACRWSMPGKYLPEPAPAIWATSAW
jgi:hypothetical protein